MSGAQHTPVSRYCIRMTTPPLPHWLTTATVCPACLGLHRAMHLDPDVTEILSAEPDCESCRSGHKHTRHTTWIEYDERPQ